MRMNEAARRIGTTSSQGDRLDGFDFAAHNAEMRAAWEAYRSGNPYRVPIILGANTRYFMRNPGANRAGLEFKRYMEDPDVMFDAQLDFQRWSRFNLLQDAELGLPARWQISVDFQNFYEAAWFGCPLAYYAGEVPDTSPVFADRPEAVMEHGLPDPFGGVMARGLEFYERFRERAGVEEYCGRPIEILPPGLGVGSDGPMTVACSLFSPTVVCTLMAIDPDRLHGLFEFITEATIQRMSAWRRALGVPLPQEGFGMADDSIALISTAMYRAHVLPYHRRLYDTFATSGPRAIHLCGDSTRHFVTLRDELNILSFDTGFPVDFGRLRKDLGPAVRIQGGPNIALLQSGTPAQIQAETRRILQSGVLEGGLFVLREGNNLAPETPLDNTEAMYHAGREYGSLEETR